MRRQAPRPVSLALEELKRDTAPRTVLAGVQEAWPRIAGAAVAAEAQPVAERAGTLSVTCRSATWAQELSLLGPELIRRLNAALDRSGEGPLRELRVSVSGPSRGPSGRT